MVCNISINVPNNYDGTIKFTRNVISFVIGFKS